MIACKRTAMGYVLRLELMKIAAHVGMTAVPMALQDKFVQVLQIHGAGALKMIRVNIK
jgi:hypothetical protein